MPIRPGSPTTLIRFSHDDVREAARAMLWADASAKLAAFSAAARGGAIASDEALKACLFSAYLAYTRGSSQAELIADAYLSR